MKFGLLACVLSIGQAVPQGDSIVDAARRQGGAVTLDIHINAGVGTVEELANLSSVLVADLEMPGLGGAEMVRQIRMIRPDLPVLYVTGYIDRLMDARPLWRREAFLEKPFSVAGFREAVSLLLYGTVRR